MSATIRTILVLLVFVGISACKKPLEKAQFFIFGTLVDITLAGVEKPRADEIFAQVQQNLRSMHRDWHPWEPGMLMTINQAFTQGKCAPYDARLRTLIESSQSVEKLTDGYFNAGIGALIDLWGFHTSEYPILTPPPTKTEIEAVVALQASAMDVYFTDNQVCSTNPATQLDFGGIAKGYAVDLVTEQLQQLGVTAAIVNTGGDLRAYTFKQGFAWRIAVRHPNEGLIGLLEVELDEAVFTSGNYQRYVDFKGKRYGHILNPRTGWPVEELSSVTVLTSEGIDADSAATALLVAGLQNWRQLAHDLGLDAVLVVAESGKLYMTPAMQPRLDLYTEDDDSPWLVEVVE